MSCSVSGTGTDARVIYALELDVPSSGLKPDGKQILLQAFRPGDVTNQAERVIAEFPDEPTGLRTLGTPYGVVVELNDPNDKANPIVTNYSPTLEPGWITKGDAVAAAGQTVYINRVQGSSAELVDDGAAIFVNARDGAEVAIYEYDSGGNGESYTTIFPVRVTAEGYVLGVVPADADEHGSWVAYLDGTTANMGYVAGDSRDMYADPFSSMALLEKTGTDLDRNLSYEVIDRVSGASVLEIGIDQFEGLHAQGMAFANKNLYILNRSDSPVIDATTGETRHAGWDRRPIASFSDRTVIAVDSSSDPIGAKCALPNYQLFSDQSVNRAFAHVVDVFSACSSYEVVSNSPDGTYPGPNF